jgi:hypothetical protein
MVKKLNIDESHGIKHSMDVLNFAHDIYSNELKKNTNLVNQQKVIYISAALHDMCDKKYINEQDGIEEINKFLNEKIDENEIKIINYIISSMSYSKVKVSGFPDSNKLGEYELAYHIVREADLLAAYDFDRCMIYHINNSNENLYHAFINAHNLFKNRVFKHFDDNLFVTNYSKKKAYELNNKAKTRIKNWKKILYKSNI